MAGPGRNNISADPRFRDPASGVVSLMPCSPCIDVGDSTWVHEDRTDLDENNNSQEITPRDVKMVDRFIVYHGSTRGCCPRSRVA